MCNYLVSAVVNGMSEELKVKAVSDKQAWYLFCQKYGYRIRDFKILQKTEEPDAKNIIIAEEGQAVQLSLF